MLNYTATQLKDAGRFFMKKDRVGLFLVFLLIIVSLLLIILPSFSSGQSGRVAIDRTISLPLFEHRQEKVIMAFFGYTGCSDICTPRLRQIAQWYATLPDAVKAECRFYFFDLSKPSDPKMPENFAKAFNAEFEGIYLDNETLNDYSRAFDVYYAPSLSSAYEIDHSPHLYMLKKVKNGYDLRYIYFSYPYHMDLIETDLKELQND